jgi:phosphoenolpyruvate carboxykinase (ATP)
MLGEKLRTQGTSVWLVNTGWTEGPFGTGHRMDLGHTRSMVKAVLAGQLENVETEPDPVFGVEVPTSVPNVPSEVLRPRDTWADPEAYDRQARKLAEMFRENFDTFADGVSDEVKAAGPK